MITITISTSGVEEAEKVVSALSALNISCSPTVVGTHRDVEKLPTLEHGDPTVDPKVLFGLWAGRDDLDTQTLRDVAWGRNSTYAK